MDILSILVVLWISTVVGFILYLLAMQIAKDRNFRAAILYLVTVIAVSIALIVLSIMGILRLMLV